jgi:uncharacterized damage-inducible protein DinB
MEWADAVAWRTVIASDEGRSDDRIRTWLHHVHTVQHAFLQIWRGEKPGFRDLAEFSDPVTLARWGREGHQQLQAFVADLTPETAAREIQLPWAGEVARVQQRTPTHPTLDQTVLQVAMHSTHHRGQVNARLREVGGEPSLTDYVVWVWWGQPDAVWTFVDR